jgi:hypothetical protein
LAEATDISGNDPPQRMYLILEYHHIVNGILTDVHIKHQSHSLHGIIKNFPMSSFFSNFTKQLFKHDHHSTYIYNILPPSSGLGVLDEESVG